MDIRNFRSVITVGLCLGAIISGCSGQKTDTVASVPAPAASTPPVETPTPVETPKELTDEEKLNKFVDSYFKEIISAGSGNGYFCEADRTYSFFSPRKYELLRTVFASKAPKGEGLSFVSVRVESNNKAGQPVIGNKTLYVLNAKPNRDYLPDSASELGYCIRSINER